MNILNCDKPSWIVLQMRKIMILIPTMILQLVMLFCLMYLCVILYQSLHDKVQKRKIYKMLVIIGLCGFIWHFQCQLLQKKLAFVVKDVAFVYAGPEQSFHTIFQLKSGTCVQLLKCQSQMCQISIDGQQGWVELSDLEIQ